MVKFKKNVFNEIIEINNVREYNKIIKDYSQYLILAYFYDNTCKNNTEILEKIKEVRNENKNNNLVFFKIDVSSNEEIISNLDITSCPMIYFYKNSEKIKCVYATYEKIGEILNNEINDLL